MVWLSLAWRARINVEALNMAESVGNYIKHRRAPIAVYENGKYVLRYVPVISGESLGHAYQCWLAHEAEKMGLNVCAMCKRGEMVKHGSRAVLKDEGLRTEVDTVKDAEELEKILIKNCVVEDVGGFLVPTRVPVKRTSRFYVGYLIPALEDIKAATLDPQFHVRHAPSMIGREKELGITEKGQAIYYVEVGSAIYTGSFALDAGSIGYTSMTKVEEVLPKDERIKRAEASIKALYYVLQGLFGANRTRFQPDYKLLSVVAAICADGPFNVSPGHTREYIVDTVRRCEKFAELTGISPVIYAYVDEPDVKVPNKVQRFETVEELVSKLVDEVRKNL